MLALRLLLLAGCLGAIALSVATARWEGRLVRGNHTWLIDLGRHPVWSPPSPPDYERFRQEFEQSEDFPPPHGCAIESSYRPAEVALEAVLYLWLVTGSCGLLYLGARGPRRDFVMHCAASVAAGLTAAVAACLALWCVAGGWGPPFPACFGVFGLVVGLARGIASFPGRGEAPVPPADAGGETAG
jgi:hypothetical protein